MGNLRLPDQLQKQLFEGRFRWMKSIEPDAGLHEHSCDVSRIALRSKKNAQGAIVLCFGEPAAGVQDLLGSRREIDADVQLALIFTQTT